MEISFDYSRLIPIVVGIVALFLGMIIGRLDRRQAREKEKNRPPEIVEKVVPEASLMSIVLDEGMRPVVKLDGVPVTSLDPDQRQRMIGLVNILRPLLDSRPAPGQTPPGPAPVSQRLSPTPGEPAAPISQRLASTPPPHGPGPISQRLSQPAPAPEVKPIPAKISFSAPSKRESQELVRPATIAAQIDEILQARLVGHPLAERGIKVMNSLTGGVDIFVGTEKFEGVGEVPYPEVKAVLQQAIAEWEKTYTPGG